MNYEFNKPFDIRIVFLSVTFDFQINAVIFIDVKKKKNEVIFAGKIFRYIYIT